jgi:hypothetical protein
MAIASFLIGITFYHPAGSVGKRESSGGAMTRRTAEPAKGDFITETAPAFGYTMLIKQKNGEDYTWEFSIFCGALTSIRA